MLTLLSLGIISIGILAVRARSISRSVGKLWIDLEIIITIIYICAVWGASLLGEITAISDDSIYVFRVTSYCIALSTYLLCAMKITIGLVRYREKSPFLSVLPYMVQAIFLVVINPINHIAYYSEVKGGISGEKIA